MMYWIREALDVAFLAARVSLPENEKKRSRLRKSLCLLLGPALDHSKRTMRILDEQTHAVVIIGEIARRDLMLSKVYVPTL